MISQDISRWINRAVNYSFSILVFLSVFLPSGSVLGVNVKIISMGIFLGLFVLYQVVSDDSLSSASVLFALLVTAALLCWALAGVLNGRTDWAQTLYQLRDVSSTIFICWFSIVLIKRRALSPQSLIATVVYGVFALALMKLVFIGAPFVSGIDIVGAIRSVFGEGSLVAGDVAFGVFRMQFSADILAPFAVFALLTPSLSGVRFGRLATSVILLVVVASGFLAFSRYIWLVFLVTMIAAAIVEKKWKMPLITAIALLAVALPLYEFFDAAFVFRFQSDAAATSDDIRVEQSAALIHDFSQHPILGVGMGANARGVIRHDSLLYSYELQWLALLMQFGIAGILGLVSLLVISTRDLISAVHPAKLWVGLLFFLWLASGFFNPYLTTSFAGVTFAFFMALFHKMRMDSTDVPIASSRMSVPYFQEHN